MIHPMKLSPVGILCALAAVLLFLYCSQKSKTIDYSYTPGADTTDNPVDITQKFEKKIHSCLLRIYDMPMRRSIPYRLFVPEQPSSSGSYPLVLALHGAGEKGSDNELQLKFKLATSWADTAVQNQWPCFVVAPQCPLNSSWVNWDSSMGPAYGREAIPVTETQLIVLDLLDSLITGLPVDPDRVYITGLSMGGHGTWDMITRFPSRFAAAVVVCGIGDTAHVEAFRDVSVWIFQGAQDNTVSVRSAWYMVESMERHGMPVFRTAGLSEEAIEAELDRGVKYLYTEYPDAGHYIWDRAYAYPPLFRWIFAQRR
ncbi:prolyl oligopeptidase family serine peptidase [bacterium]|nr:prolyl oligopeptidase family serine peptidase [bacterium]